MTQTSSTSLPPAPPLHQGFSSGGLRRFDSGIRVIQDMLKHNGVKMSAIEIRELVRNRVLGPSEDLVKAYVKKLRQGG